MEAKILVSSRSYGRFFPNFVEDLRKFGEVRVVRESPLKEDRMLGLVGEFDAIIVGTDEVTSSVIEKGERLKIIAKHGVGLDNIDVKAATERGIVVTYTPSANATAVAEHTLALILALTKGIPKANESGKSGQWRSGKVLGIELRGKVLGVVGLGKIGTIVASMARRFDMRVVAYDPFVGEEVAKEVGVKLVDLDELFRGSDIVTVHAALTPETRHMIGAREVGLMKKTAYLVNTARGAIIDEKALAKALKEKRIAGAALDVLEEEPPRPDNELLKMENAIITPHCAAYTLETMQRMDEMVTEDVSLVLSNRRPKNVANPEVLEGKVGR